MSLSYRTFLGLDELPEGTTHASSVLELCSPLACSFGREAWASLLTEVSAWLQHAVSRHVVISAAFDTADWLIDDSLGAFRRDTSKFAGSGWLGWETLLDNKHWRLFIDAVYAACVASAEDVDEACGTATKAVICGNAAVIAAAYPLNGFAADQTEAAIRDAIESAARHYHGHHAA